MRIYTFRDEKIAVSVTVQATYRMEAWAKLALTVKSIQDFRIMGMELVEDEIIDGEPLKLGIMSVPPE